MIYFPGPEHGVLCILIVDIISRSTLVVIIMLSTINCHYNKGNVCYVFPLTVNITTINYWYCYYLYYREIHQCRYIHWYFALTYKYFVIFIMLYFKLSPNFAFLTQIESVHLCYFQTQRFCSRQRNSLFSILYPQQQVQR